MSSLDLALQRWLDDYEQIQTPTYPLQSAFIMQRLMLLTIRSNSSIRRECIWNACNHYATDIQIRADRSAEAAGS